MPRNTIFALVALLAASYAANAETIILNGERITDVTVFESANRVYIEFADGSNASYPKTVDIIIGEARIKAMDEAAAQADADARAAAEAAAAAKAAEREARAQLQLAGAATTNVGGNFEVNAMVIGQGGTYAAFATVDTAFVEEELIAAVAEKLRALDSEITRGNLVLGATGVYTTLWQGAAKNRMSETLLHKHDPAVFDEAAQQIADTLHRAESGMAEALFQLAESDAPNFHTAREGASPTADSTLGVLLATHKESGAPIGGLVNYALVPALKADVGLAPKEDRGAPGQLAHALRQKISADMPVLFFNGAAGDTVPNPDADIADLAGVVTAVLESAPKLDAANIIVAEHRHPLPPTLMAGVMPQVAHLQEVRIGDAALVTIPAALASQWGQLLRAKAAHQNIAQVFLLCQTGGFAGYHPAVDEFLAVSEEVRLAFYGPITGLHFAERYFGEAEGINFSEWVPALNEHLAAYQQGVERGTADAQAIADTWTETGAKLAGLMPMLDRFELPAEAKAIISGLSQEELLIVGRQLLAMFARGEFAPFDRAQMVQLIGVAHGANAPFDAVFLLQVFADPKVIPNQQVAAGLQLFQLKGINFLTE